MSQQPFSTAALRGAVDLGALAAANQRKASGPAGALGAGGSGGAAAAAGLVVDVTEANFQDVVLERSLTIPVVVDLWTTRAQPSIQLSATLDKLATEYAGRFVVARIDVDASPALAQAFQVQTLPFLVAVIKGQPVPLVADLVPEEQLRQVLDQLLEVATQNGVTGQLDVTGVDPETSVEAAPVEEELPPLHQAAYDAIDRDDLDAAVSAYEQAIRESPADEFATIGLINVRLMQRVADVQPATVLAAADGAPEDTAAQLLAADVEFLEGRVDAAFDRLVEAVRSRSGDEREEVRRRLVDLFALVGSDDPQVRRARIALTNALF
jgi:putative thioredoxin